MWRVVVRGLQARKLRLALTAFAVVLGVSFLAGTFVLTDTLQRRFDSIFQSAVVDIDVTVQAQSDFGEGSFAQRARLPEETLPLVQGLPGVAAADGTVVGLATIIGPDGEVIEPPGGPPLGFSVGETEGLSLLRPQTGRFPQNAGEVAIDPRSAERAGVELGDTVRVQALGPAEPFTVVGTVSFGAEGAAGVSLATFTTDAGQRLFDAPGQFDRIFVRGERGVTPQELRAQVAAVLPPGVEALTGTEFADEDASNLQEGVEIFQRVLVVFGGIGVFVGGFIILNTFAILVAQRRRELGMLRAVGGSSRQILGAVLGEALAVGLFASAVGLGLGVALPRALLALQSRIGFTFPDGPLVISSRTVVAAFVVGVSVTVLAALFPAWRAGRLTPVAAMRDIELAPSRRAAVGLLGVGGVAVLAGVALLARGVTSDAGNALDSVGLGMVLVFVGVTLLSPFFAAPLARVLGSPLPRVAGLPGRLARANAERNPRRTAATAGALVIGVSLMTLVSITAASVKASLDAAFDTGVRGELVLAAGERFRPFSPEVVREVAALPEVAAATGLRTGEALVDGLTVRVTGADPVALARTADLGAPPGAVERLEPGAVLVSQAEADARGLDVGDTVTVQLPLTGPQPATITGTYTRDRVVLSDYLIPQSLFEVAFGRQLDALAYVALADGVSEADGLAAVERVLDDFPTVQPLTRDEFRSRRNAQVDQFVAVVYALLAFAVLIALLGITNTLALSIVERTREIGLLRVVGMARRQVRTMVRWEAVVIALIGAVIGLALGTAFGWAAAEALRAEGLTRFVVPGVQLLVLFAAAGFAGVLFAVLPARRAARLDVLAAIHTE